jgi:hypothetical protein
VSCHPDRAEVVNLSGSAHAVGGHRSDLSFWSNYASEACASACGTSMRPGIKQSVPPEPIRPVLFIGLRASTFSHGMKINKTGGHVMSKRIISGALITAALLSTTTLANAQQSGTATSQRFRTDRIRTK